MFILVTGGAGFIGSHVVDAALRCGYKVRVLDTLEEQVHKGVFHPLYLPTDIEFVEGNVCNVGHVRKALKGVDAVIHLAALVGVGQSMYEMARYTHTNNLGTAVLLEAIAKVGGIKRLVVASSMSIYGEGMVHWGNGQPIAPKERSVEQLRRGRWEIEDERGYALQPLATPETKEPALTSIYALSKFDQERMCLIAGRAYNIPTVALRFFNVYGPRQALSNPYTGVLAIFASRLLNRNSPLVFEDGLQTRDFVHVRDVARACLLALRTEHFGEVYNVGTGRARTILAVAENLARVMKVNIAPTVTGRYRAGDIRHCVASTEKARTKLDFTAQIRWEEGLKELAEWLKGQQATDRVEEATAELAERGLISNVQ